MAIENLLVYDKANDGMALPLSISRGNPNPLDDTYLHQDLTALSVYAKTDPTAYVGQICACYTSKTLDDGTIVKGISAYIIINADGDLKLIATADAEIDLGALKQALEEAEKDREKIKKVIGIPTTPGGGSGGGTTPPGTGGEGGEGSGSGSGSGSGGEGEGGTGSGGGDTPGGSGSEGGTDPPAPPQTFPPTGGYTPFDPDSGQTLIGIIDDIGDKVGSIKQEIKDDMIGDESIWATEEDIDNLYADIFADLGW